MASPFHDPDKVYPPSQLLPVVLVLAGLGVLGIVTGLVYWAFGVQ